MITTKITIKPHLKEYVIGKFAGCIDGPVRFDDKTDIYYTIWDLTEKRPVNCLPDKGNLEIVLPVRREGKPPETYNYLGIRSHRIIERKIENIFFAELHDMLTEEKHRYGITYIEAIYSFTKKYNISSISEDGLKKDYYRWKDILYRRKKRGYVRKNILMT
ncbi:MAG TPA: hypothetical protein DEQ30_04955 [Porphyromonadaceae bacterium]|nr:hypothetical protein [Porphyromonadaceae bacterium]